MITTVGSAGPGVRSDVRITLSEGSGLDVVSSVESMYGDALRRQIEGRLAHAPALQVTVEDSGALPFVIDARLDAALARHLGEPLPHLSARPSTPQTMLRTRLYVPGNTPKFLPHVGLFDADWVILDLEDSVPAGVKDEALALVRRALATLDFGLSARSVRVNAGPNEEAELRALAPLAPEAFVLPKVESAERMESVAALLDGVGCKARLIPIIETARGLARAEAIASATPRTLAVALGVEDYLADIGAVASESREELSWALGALVNATRSAGVAPLAPIVPTLDGASAEEYARKMASRGFEGVGCLHPNQIQPAHRGFSPTPEEADRASRIVQAYEQALAEGRGAVQVDGAMVDVPVVERARRTLARWEGGR